MTDLPRLLVLTDRHAAAGPLNEVVAGAPAVVFREKDLPESRRRRMAATLSPPVLIIASANFGTGWTHLSAVDPVPPGTRWGRSCHDDAEVEAAVEQGASYITVSPVRPTRSKPGYGPPLGIDGVTRLVERAGAVPVFALGGIEPGHVLPFLDAGAYGVAVMGAVMSAPDPAAVIASLTTDVHQQDGSVLLVHISRNGKVG